MARRIQTGSGVRLSLDQARYKRTLACKINLRASEK